MSANIRGDSGHFGNSHAEEEYSSLGSNADEPEIDFDFSITESGRTVAHLVAAMKDDHDEVGFDITESGRTVETYNSGGEAVQNAAANPLPTVGLPAKPQSAAVPIPQPNQGEFQSGSAESSGSAFLSGIMNPSDAYPMSHTPPNFTPSSYEAQHFGKRPRSGSVSGRLRSASVLEDTGVIDRHQKGVLKDLIISGDEELQAALDKYEKGDRSTLENMIQGGALLNRASADINLLDDLDLDFLTVDDDIGAGMEMAGHSVVPASALPNEPVASSSPTRAIPVPMAAPPNFPTKQQVQQMTSPNLQPNMVSPSACEGDDGIGDLDFNADFGGQNDDYHKLPSQPFGATKAVPSPNILEEQQRFRSNSLAFGALLSENPASSDGHEVYSGWMDSRVANNAASLHNMAPVQNPNASDGGMVIPNQSDSNDVRQGGIGASLARYGRSKSDSKLKTKSALAEERRRERQEKKEQREREKREKKERREQQVLERRASQAREKQERKDKKAAAKARQSQKDDGEERKETPSGLGRPRSMSDPNLKTTMDASGLLQVERPDGWIGAYSPESRKMRIDRFLAKRDHRVWTKTVKYDVRKNFADSRLRVKGRFVKKEDERLMRDLISLT